MTTDVTSRVTFGDQFLDLLANPVALFGRPFEQFRWLNFFIVTVLCGAASGLLLAPAVMHSIAATPFFYDSGEVGRDSTRAATLIAQRDVLARLLWLTQMLMVTFGVVLAAGLTLLIQPVVRAKGTISEWWTIVNEIAVIKLGLSTLFLAIIVVLRGSSSFDSPPAIYDAMPSAAWLFSDGSSSFLRFMGLLDPFNIWTVGLFFVAFRRVGRLNIMASSIVALTLTFGPQLALRVG